MLGAAVPGIGINAFFRVLLLLCDACCEKFCLVWYSQSALASRHLRYSAPPSTFYASNSIYSTLGAAYHPGNVPKHYGLPYYYPGAVNSLCISDLMRGMWLPESAGSFILVPGGSDFIKQICQSSVYSFFFPAQAFCRLIFYSDGELCGNWYVFCCYWFFLWYD